MKWINILQNKLALLDYYEINYFMYLGLLIIYDKQKIHRHISIFVKFKYTLQWSLVELCSQFCN